MALQRAEATLLFEDGFNYSTGSFGPADSSPAGFSGNAWTGGSSHITVTNQNLTYSGLQDLGGNAVWDAWGVSAGTVLNTYTSQTAGSVYYSFLLNALVAPSGSSSSSYLTSLNPGAGPPNGSSDALQVDVQAATGGYEVGLRTSGENMVFDTATVLSLNTTYLVVVEYTFGAPGSAALYLDPVAGASQPTASVTSVASGSVTALADVGFKTQGNTTTGSFLIDNVLIGTTWGDVTPQAVPEPQSYVLMGMGLLGLVLRYRQNRSQP